MSSGMIEACEQGKPPVKRGWRVVKVLLAAILAIALALKIDSFLFGLYGYPSYISAFALFPGFVVGLAAFVYLFVRIVRKLVRWRARRFWTASTLILIGIVFYYLPIPTEPYVHAMGFSIWVKNNIDIESVAAWTKTFQPPEKTKDSISDEYYSVPPSSLPLTLRSMGESSWYKDAYAGANRRLGPIIYFHRKDRTLVLSYGGSMIGKWSVTIGQDATRKAYDPEIVLGADAYVSVGGS